MHLGQQVTDMRQKGVLLGKVFVLVGLSTILFPQVWIPGMAFVRQDQPAVKDQDRRLSLSRGNEKEEGLGFDEPSERLQRPYLFLMRCL